MPPSVARSGRNGHQFLHKYCDQRLHHPLCHEQHEEQRQHAGRADHQRDPPPPALGRTKRSCTPRHTRNTAAKVDPSGAERWNAVTVGDVGQHATDHRGDQPSLTQLTELSRPSA